MIYELTFPEITLNVKIYTNRIFPKAKYRKFMKLQYNRDTKSFSSIVYRKVLEI